MLDVITVERFGEIISSDPIHTMSYCTCGGGKCHRVIVISSTGEQLYA